MDGAEFVRLIVEYYFADFLSVLESGRDEDGRTWEGLRLHTQGREVKDAKGFDIPETLRLPPNLYFTGTVNVDDTTSTFSPKVLDRAFTLELNSARFENYPPAINPEADGADDPASGEPWQDLRKNFTRDGRFLPGETARKEAVESFVNTPEGQSFRAQLDTLAALLESHEFHFAYRVFDDVMLFLREAKSSPVFEGFGNPPLDAAFDAVVWAKVLPKFHGARARLEKPLLKVVRWCQSSEAGAEVAEVIERQVRQWQSNSNREQLEKDRNAWTQEVRRPTGPSPSFRYPRTAAKALRMLADLDTTGFAAFA